MNELDEETISQMNIAQLWQTTQQYIHQGLEKPRYYTEIKEGFKIPVTIYYFINDWYEVYPSGKRAKIYGHGKYSLRQFMEEKEKRETALRQYLLENIDNDLPTQPRT